MVLQWCWPSQSFLATFKEELDGFVGNPCQIMLTSSSGQKRKEYRSLSYIYVFNPISCAWNQTFALIPLLLYLTARKYEKS